VSNSESELKKFMNKQLEKNQSEIKVVFEIKKEKES
jgi:hypothetical protein